MMILLCNFFLSKCKKLKWNILSLYSHFFGKKSPNFEYIYNISSHFYFHFNLVAFINYFFKLFRHDLETSCHLMLNPFGVLANDTTSKKFKIC
jgi:hypothetical protein